MPQIIVLADRTDRGEDMVMFRERVNLSDFESEHFARQLSERLRWAVEDAHEVQIAQEVESAHATDAAH